MILTPRLHRKMVKEFKQIARDTAIKRGITDEDAIRRLEDIVAASANRFAPPQLTLVSNEESED